MLNSIKKRAEVITVKKSVIGLEYCLIL